MWKLVAFVRKRRQWIAVAGPIIIFFTFVIKQGMRDDLKELVLEIDLLGNLLDIRDNNALIVNNLDAIAKGMFVRVRANPPIQVAASHAEL